MTQDFEITKDRRLGDECDSEYNRVQKAADVENINKEKYDELDRIIKRYSAESGQLIRILQKAQDIFGYLPERVQAYISEKTGIPVSEINGVVTFYALFSTEPKGKYELNVCMGTACYVKGSSELMEAIKGHLRIADGDTAADGLFTLKSTRCVGACGLAPILTINDKVYGKIGSSEVVKIIQKYKKAEGKEPHKH